MSGSGTSETRGVVVVGVDGSAGARAALRWAIAEARLRQARLRAVHAWAPDYGAGYLGGGYASIGGGYGYAAADAGDYVSAIRQAAEEMLERVIAELAAEAEGVEIEREVIEGVGAQVLVEAAGAGDLLVVGSRGHGGFAGLLLGSVSQQCAHHARCPVVIVHADKPSPSEADSANAAPVASEPAA
jgi:nucleotide-binding universal stress UspA family protein